MIDGTTTRSPLRTLLTSRPTSTTSPMNSWPRMSPSRIIGMWPTIGCRSDPQVVELVILSITSLRVQDFGSATVSTRRS